MCDVRKKCLCLYGVLFTEPAGPLPSGCAFGIGPGWTELRPGFGRKGRSMKWETGLLGDEARADRANKEGTIGQPLVEDLAYQEPSGVHLHAGLETLFRDPVLRLFPLR